MDMPSVGSPYFDAATETMDRTDLEAMQEERLRSLLPHAYEHSPLVRRAWDEAGAHPRDVRTLDDFAERAPFVDKATLRRWRTEHADPYGGLLAVPEDDLTAVMSTSGTTGAPTLVPEQWGGGGRPAVLIRDFWGMGVRPGDHIALFLFTYRGPIYGFVHLLECVPILLDYDADELERLCELSLAYRPTTLYNLGNTMVHALGDLAERTGIDLADVFASYRGVVSAGEPLGRRARERAASWGVDLYEHSRVGDVTGSFECGEHDGLHVWEDTALVECLDPDGADPVPDGDRGELVATTLVNEVAPLVRYRSDDLVRVTRERCACGRTHLRMFPLGRKGDEVVVDGRSVLPSDVWDAVETVDATAAGLFQVVRPDREVDRLRLRVGHAGVPDARLDSVRDDVVGAVAAAVGVEPEVELVPQGDLLRLGPPHKIPRVTPR